MIFRISYHGFKEPGNAVEIEDLILKNILFKTGLQKNLIWKISLVQDSPFKRFPQADIYPAGRRINHLAPAGCQQITHFVKIMHELAEIPVVSNLRLKQLVHPAFIDPGHILLRHIKTIFVKGLGDTYTVPEKQKNQKMMFIQKSNIVFCKII